MTINRAVDLLEPNESALAVFTRGDHLEMYSDGSGSSGNWVIKPNRQLDKFIIYYRHMELVPTQVEVYLADYIDVAPSKEGSRLIVNFKNARRMGTTNSNWYEFVGPGTAP